MSGNLSFGTEAAELVLRCECGAIVRGDCEQRLVEVMRLHLGEFHPDLGANLPVDLILAMAEQKGSGTQ
jgi:hypothetical protein